MFKTGCDKLKKNLSNENFFSLEAKNIEGVMTKMNTYNGKKAIVVVNVACKCGLTGDHYT